MTSMKTWLWWAVALAGAVLILAAPINLKGLGMAAGGVVLLVAGLVPAMQARRQARLLREQQLAMKAAEDDSNIHQRGN